ncbi:hypothetical protein FNH05_16835 [Amycolatopsis rhizosphaerae]|uniref:Copper-containing nitrite reductase n=1 Tax=Amycolatopsis rhizosphaerae TaxID=2053003 RepID=A0A558CL40_9PSEU|nr:multicopper oxidase domain-containing protein [Amycolatopsis rhizosphaerae]TVT49488.1 hypothetical protein FNH05_16835 [Amycolatopsis rhizosphaerae]
MAEHGPETTAYRSLPVAEPAASPRKRRHAVTAGIVAAYLVAAAVLGSMPGLVAMPSWLALHLLALGAATTAVFVYTRHFAQALLHARPGPERAASARLVALNLGVAAVLAGVPARLPWLVAAGASAVVLAVLGHVAALVRMASAAVLAGRLRIAVRYYIAAGAALAVGGTLGGLLGTGAIASAAWEPAVRLAHAHLNLLGWLGLAVLGTQFMLWPAVLRTRMAEDAPRAARAALVPVTAGLAVAAAALLAGPWWPPLHWVAAAGMALYTAGVVRALLPAVTEMRAKAPRQAAPMALLLGHGWLLVALVADVAALASGPGPADRLLAHLLVPVLALGVVAQILTGALTFLIPVTLGGGPVGNRRLASVLSWAWQARAGLGNLGVLLLAVPSGAALRVPAWALVVLGFGSFPVLVVVALVLSRRPAREPGDRWRLAGYEALAVGCVAVVVVALGLVAAGWPGRGERPASGPAATAASGVPVAVTLDEFSVTPSVIVVRPGTDLVLAVRNTGRLSHDLRLDGGRGTHGLAPGEEQTVDLGAVEHDEQAWCTVPGHHEAGMTLTIRTADSAPGPVRSPAPEPARQPFDAALAPAPGGTEHTVTLRVEQRTEEVAPGVRQEVWTYNGTVPGPVLHGRVGDTFTVHLVNGGTMEHSLDFHASQVDPGTVMRPVPPGGELVYRFRAEYAGIWLYHCGTEPMIEHVAMGMYGAVVIDPPTSDSAGASIASEVFVQSEFYLGDGGGVPQRSRLLSSNPDLVVFNGYAGQYRTAPIHVPAGKRVRLWVLDAGPNVPAAFHVVGTQFDTVYKEGAYLVTPGAGAAQELDLQPGEGGFVELTFPQPGTYPFLTHRLADAERGAMGTIIADPAP